MIFRLFRVSQVGGYIEWLSTRLTEANNSHKQLETSFVSLKRTFHHAKQVPWFRSLFPGVLTIAILATGAAAQDDKFKVATTFTVIADMVRNVAGDVAVVVSITKAGAEIHGYYLHEFQDGLKAKRVIDGWIRFYNAERPHIALEKQTPDGQARMNQAA